MNCSQYQELIDLSFGQKALPDGIQSHLASCPQCKEYYSHLLEMAQLMKDTDTARPTDLEEKAIFQNVMSAIEQVDNTEANQKIKSIRPLTRWIAAAAATLLIAFSTFWISTKENKDNNIVANIDSGTIQTEESISPLEYDGFVELLVVNDSSYTPDQNAYEMLLDEYAFGRSLVAGDQILDDISEDELKFLEENFDVEELIL